MELDTTDLPGMVRNMLRLWDAHAPEETPSMVSYQPDTTKRKRGVYILVKPAKLLRRVYELLGLDLPEDHVLRDQAQLMMPQGNEDKYGITFITGGPLIAEFYQEAPIDSCMSKHKEEFTNAYPFHPCTAYAKGWRLAVMYRGGMLADDYSNAVARAMVIDQPQHKVYTSTYINKQVESEIEIHNIFKKKLREEGFHHVSNVDFSNAAVDARVEFDWLTSDNGCTVFPYIDGESLSVVESGGTLFLTWDDIDSVGCSQNSYDESGTCESGAYCQKCLSRCRHSETIMDDYMGWNVCPNCAESELTRAYTRNGAIVFTSSRDIFTDENGDVWVSKRAAAMYAQAQAVHDEIADIVNDNGHRGVCY